MSFEGFGPRGHAKWGKMATVFLRMCDPCSPTVAAVDRQGEAYTFFLSATLASRWVALQSGSLEAPLTAGGSSVPLQIGLALPCPKTRTTVARREVGVAASPIFILPFPFFPFFYVLVGEAEIVCLSSSLNLRARTVTFETRLAKVLCTVQRREQKQ